VRAAFSERLPGLSHVFHIRPWEVGLLTPAERELFIDRLPEGW
jgi:hypothetical protein